jgi:hypothetical protein
MNHSESEYINAGFAFGSGHIQGETLRKMIESERVEDRAEARRLIALGRAEAR